MRHSGKRMMSVALFALFGSTSVRAAPQPGVSSQIERAMEMNSTEKISYVAKAVGDIRDTRAEVEAMVDTAIRRPESFDQNCLEQRLLDIITNESNSQTAQGEMLAAIDRSDDARALLEYRKVAILLGKTQMKFAEAENRCKTGGGEAKSGETLINVEIEGELELVGDDPLEENDIDMNVDPPEQSLFVPPG